jgi:UDP-glucuronate 4-epimerase
MDHNERFLVTGALGCIGAWVVRNLVREGIPVAIFDRATDWRRLRLIMSDDELAQIESLTGDIRELADVERALDASSATNIIHLAALQVPFCKADPVLGAQVNVVGPVNVFEAAMRRRLRRVVYASSVAVYGASEEYPEGPVAHDAPLRPRTLYGVYKQANEGTARVYWTDHGISSIGLRPHVVYGPGRDQGMTSGPTAAMLAAVLGEPYSIPFGGRIDMQFADDVAGAFIRATRVPFEAAEVFSLHGSVVDISEIIAAIEEVVPEARGTLSFRNISLGLPEELDTAHLEDMLGPLPRSPFAGGVALTIGTFRQAIHDGRLVPKLP